MFNNYNTSSNVKINAVTGAILKNHPKSWFETLNLNSSRAKKILAEGGYKFDCQGTFYEKNMYEKYKGITVLQMVVCGDMEVLAECVYTADYEKVEVDEI